MSDADHKKYAPAIVVMGVSACGKSTVGQGIADALQIPFEDGDKYHPEPNIAKMRSGTLGNCVPAIVLFLRERSCF